MRASPIVSDHLPNAKYDRNFNIYTYADMSLSLGALQHLVISEQVLEI
jgi:hypothetical protein